MRNVLLQTMCYQPKPFLPTTSPTCLRPFGIFFRFPRCWQRLRSFSRSELYWWWWSLFFLGRYDSPLVSASRFFLARGFCLFSTRSWGFRAMSFCRGKKEEKKNTVVKIRLQFGLTSSSSNSRWPAKHSQENPHQKKKKLRTWLVST